MANSRPVEKLENHLKDKRNELIWALALQDYSHAQIARIFGIAHRSTVLRIVQQKPRDWRPKWEKVRE